jgi:hypothetical protein
MNRLPDDWFEEDVVVLLPRTAKQIPKGVKGIKDYLSSNNIKYTTDKTKSNRGINSNINFKSTPKELSVKDLYNIMINGNSEVDLESDEQLLQLLTSTDKTNVELAIQLIGNNIISKRILPWLLLNKDNESVKNLLITRGIKLNTWRAGYYKWEIIGSINDLRNRLNIDIDDIPVFINDILKYTKWIQ